MTDGTGPEVYQLAQAHQTADARAALERVLGVGVVSLRHSRSGASHAVYLATLTDGRECVARFATHPDHALAGCELGAEGVRGRRPVPVAFFKGCRSRCAIEPSYVEARDVFKLYYLLSWLYIPYDPRYHDSPAAMARSIADHEGAILALVRGERHAAPRPL